eukprot:jgi/Bigna1/145505/aug1.100_g20213
MKEKKSENKEKTVATNRDEQNKMREFENTKLGNCKPSKKILIAARKGGKGSGGGAVAVCVCAAILLNSECFDLDFQVVAARKADDGCSAAAATADANESITEFKSIGGPITITKQVY